MKALILFIVLIPCLVFSQEKTDTNWVYIDSVKYNLSKTFIDPKNVKHLYTAQHPDDTIYTTHKPGKRYLERKKKSRIVPLSSIINGMKSNNKIPVDERISVVIDGALLLNPEEYYIEESYIKEVTFIIDDPKQSGDHTYQPPSIIIKTKK